MLLGFELRKIWQNRIFVSALMILACVNLFFLWTQGRPSAGREGIDAAYRKLGSEIAFMGTEEKEQYVESQYRLIHAMSTIDSVEMQIAVTSSQNVASLREENKDIYEAYYETYQMGEYLQYTSSIPQEYAFLHSIYLELEQVRLYPEFLQDIESKAQTISDISIFADSGGYNDQNLNKTAADFAGMRDIHPDFYPQKGLHIAIGFPLTDLIILFIMLFMAFSLVREEIDTGGLLYIRTMPCGRLSTALTKMVAMAVSILAVIVVMYGCNLIFCGLMYGFGNLFAPVQSYYFLMRSTLKCNLLIYLCLFMFTKWVAVFVVGLWVLLACTLTRKAGTGYLLAIAFPLGCEVLRRVIPATSQYNLLKYSSITSLAQTNELLGNYRNLNVLGQPMHLFSVEAVAAMFYLTLFGCWFCARFCRWQVRVQRSASRNKCESKHRKPLGFFAQEAFKMFISNGGILAVLAFVIVQFVFVYNAESYITPEEVYYRYYLKVVDGPITPKKLDWLREQGEEFKPLLELESALRNGLIDAQAYESQLNMYVGLRDKYMIYRQVCDELMIVYQNPGHQMIYENGYKRLFGIGGRDNLTECLVVCLALCIICSPVFANERQTQMRKLITITPLGRHNIVTAKLWTCGSIAAGLGVLSLLPGLVIVLRDYWFSAPIAPMRSMQAFAGAPINVPVFVLIALMVLLRVLGCLAVAVVVLAISEKIGNTVVSTIVSSILFCLPSLLTLASLEGMKWVGVYPLFNFAAMLTNPANTIPAFLYPAMWLKVGGFCVYWLYEKYPQKFYLEYGKLR